MRFLPSTPPVRMPPLGPDEQHTPESVRAFFGNMPRDDEAFLTLPTDWARYCDAWPKLSSEQKALSPGAFWRDPAVIDAIGCRPTLSDLGEWYANHSMSNVSAERGFGHMRASESIAASLHMSTASARQEALARANGPLIEVLLAAALAAAIPRK